MEFHVVIPVLISFAISLVLGPIVIPFLRRLKMGQTERELGVQSHLKKNGTPTMGGVIFLIATTVTSLFYIRDYPMIIPVLFLTLGFGLIGFLDDYLKVVLKRSDGLLPWQKMALQIVVTAVFAFYLVNYSNVSLTMKIPFWSGHYLNLGWFAVPVLFFAVIGTVNGVNFTDGLDGLASSVTLIVAVFFTVVSLGMNSGVEPITCAVVGSLMGFLLFNVYPAKVFMGDTGSLALGGFVAGVAYAMQMPLFIILVGLIYLDRKAGELGGAQYGPIQGVGNHRHVVHGALLAPVLLVVDPHHGEGLTAEVDGLPDGIRILKQAVRHVGAEHAHPAAPVDVKGADVPPLLQGVVPADGELVAAQVECPTVQRGGAVFHGQACGQIGAHPQHHIAQLSIPIVIEGVHHIHRPASVIPVHCDVDLIDTQLLIVGGDVRVVAGHQRHQH